MPFTNLNRKLSRRDRIYGARPKRRSFKKTLIRLFLIFLILFLMIFLPVRGVYQSLKRINTAAKTASAGLKSENLDTIRSSVKEMKSASAQLDGSLNWLFWVRIIPFLGNYYADAKHFAKAANYELEAAQTITDSLDPYKKELGFSGTPTPGQDRVAQAVKILNKVIPELDKVQPELKSASEEVANIDVNKYPEKWGSRNVRSLVDTAKNFIGGAYYAVSQARPALEIAPQALGEPSAKNYLIIFQNDKELRATGGFMTAYAFLKLDHGHISSSTSDDIYRLDEKLLEVCKTKVCPLSPPAVISKYLPEANGKPRTAWSMRDSNLSPDLPTSLRQFEKMYGLIGDGTTWDGIITIDTHVVEELIKITGPIEVFGTKYSADIDKRCNCPNVIYELEAYSQIIEKGEKDRKAILGTLMQQILSRSLGASTEKLPEFINAGVKLAQSKHVMLFMHDDKIQKAVSSLDWTGEIKSTSGDYLHINDSNFAGGKSNLYVTEDVSLDIDPKTGTHKLEITYKNPQVYSSWLNQRNRDYVRIYVPKGAKLVSSKGSDVAVTTIDNDLGKTVYEAFIEIRPQNSRVLNFVYQTSSPYEKDGKYPLLIQRQPGTKDFSYTVKLNGNTKSTFNLDMDKSLNL